MEDLKTDIWMPLYIADYLADTAYLTTEQSGAYLHLLMAYWRNGPPPDNDAILASITKLSPDAWSNARAVLVQYFEVSGGRWHNKRADAEIATARENRQKNHDRAAKAAAARWAKQNGMLEALPVHYAEQCPSPSPSPTSSKATSKASARGTRLPADWSLPADWEADAVDAGVPQGAVRAEADKFRDYWTAKAGSGATKLNWQATWRNWCRTSVERTYRRATNASHQPGGRTRGFEATDAIDAEWLAERQGGNGRLVDAG